MKKQNKPKAATDKQAAKKPKAQKAQTGNFKFTVGGVSYEIGDTAGELDLLKALVVASAKISEQIESLRRTLWRMEEIRDYENKPKAAAKGKPKGGEK